MPEEMERALKKEAKGRHYGKERTGAFVYGTMRKHGWKPQREMAKGGIVDEPTVALIGEKGPEAVIPIRGRGRADFDDVMDEGEARESALEEKREGAKSANVQATYSGPEARCANCEYFDGEARCNLGAIDADPEGRCDEFQTHAGDEEAEGYDDSGEAEFEEV